MQWLLVFAGCSVLMVVGMVQYTTALVAPAPSSHARWAWGGVYAAAMVGLVYAMQFIAPGQRGVMLLVPAGWIAMNAGFVRLWAGMAAASRSRGGPDDMPPDAEAIGDRASRLALLALALTAIALWQLGAPQQFLAFVTAPGHRLAAAAIAIGVAGWAALLGGGVRMAMGIGRDMTHEEIEEMERTSKFGPDVDSPLLHRRSKYRIYGRAKGLEGHVTVTFDEIRDAWRSGLWRRDPAWQTIFMMMIGGLVMAAGGIAAVFVLGSTNTRIVFAGLLLYAGVQAAIGIRAGRRKRKAAREASGQRS